MSTGSQFRPVFRAIVCLTIGCGLSMIGVGLLPVFVPDAAKTPFIEALFNTLSYIFSSGVGVVFGALAFGSPIATEPLLVSQPNSPVIKQIEATPGARMKREMIH